MLINVDVNSLIYNRLTVDLYLILQLINDKQYDTFNKYLALYTNEEKKTLFNKLNTLGYCINRNGLDEYDPNKIEITTSFSKFLLSGDFFDELVQVFPVSVTRSDGTRDYLRVDLKRSKIMYSKITKNKLAMHNHILDCLRFEIATKTRNNGMQWMKRLPKWLVSEEWKVYEQALQDAKYDSLTHEDLGYGTKLE